MDLPPVSAFAHDPIRAYVEALLSKAGFAHAPAEERAETVAALTAEAQRRIGLELSNAIDRHSLGEFRSMASDGAGEDEMAAFFDVRVPDAEARVRQALDAFGRECLEHAARLRGELHL
ncbi:MAG: hypothetical protein AAB554_05735 [Patescibacteria group bacterium]